MSITQSRIGSKPLTVPLTALLLCTTLFSAGCAEPSASDKHAAMAEKQCWEIMRHYLKIAADQDSQTTRSLNAATDRLLLSLAFSTQSALGPVAAKSSCEYPATPNNKPLLPSKVVIGKTTFDQPKDILELAELKSNWDFLEHDDHHH